jgi:ankyrin repeat protein
MKNIIEIINNLEIKKLEKWLKQGNDPDIVLGDDYKFTILQYVLDGLDDDENQQIINIVNLLIDYNVNVNECLGEYNEHPLFKAIKENNLSIVKILLKAGATIDFADDIGDSPLRYAVEHDLYGIVEELLRYANVEELNIAGGLSGSTALGIALSKLNLKLIHLLLSKGANVNTIDLDGKRSIERLPDNIDEAISVEIDALIRKYNIY